jgi:hypothetical protein
MRELSFAEVRAAGLRAYVEFAYVGYEYRPLYDDVAIHIPPACESCGTTRSAGRLASPGEVSVPLLPHQPGGGPR